jgi:hypothetical protein
MTRRQRLEAIVAGQLPDRIPAVWRMDKWHRSRRHAGNLPPELSGLSLEQVEDHLGLGRSARAGKVFRDVLDPPVERRETRSGDQIVTEYRTPMGTLTRVNQFGPGDEAAGLSPTITKYPITEIADYAAYRQVVEHTRYVPTYAEFEAYDRMIGQAGLPMVILGPNPIHELWANWTGYENGYLHLNDAPDVVRETVEAVEPLYRQMWPIVADSPARLIMHGVNFDSAMTPPDVFREHFVPYLKAFNDRMHKAGKYVACHADGDMTALLDLVVEAGFDVADCFACAPLVRCTFDEARAAWANRITIWGGLPSTLLEPNVSLDALRNHLVSIYTGLGDGRRFILGISDQAMPTSSCEHLKCAAEFAKKHAVWDSG